MGCVAEPYLPGTPDVAVFTERLIHQAFSFGEAAYACQAVLSWQTTVVGDPLYRPFSREPDELHMDLTRRKSPLLAWSWLRLVNLNLAVGRPANDAINLLEQLPLTKESSVLSEKVGDLYAAQGKPSSCVHAWTQALKLDTTPQQRVRLTLELAEKLISLDRDSEALDYYAALLKDLPDTAQRIMVLQKAAPLAEKLKKAGEAEKYRAELLRLAPPPPK